MAVASVLLATMTNLIGASSSGPPLPTPRQLDFMDMETVQFMHFNVNTAWNASDAFLHGKNPTDHNCNRIVSGTSNDSQTEGVWPCLSPKIFNPINIDTEQWMRSATAMGMKEICLTAKHAGGFTMWPSNHTPYGIHGSTSFQNGKGDILRDFVASAKRWGINVCYYINPMTDGFLTQIARYDEEQYMAAEKGMLTEILQEGSPYGPVDRLWFDGVITDSAVAGDFRPGYLGTNYSFFYDECFELIRKISPSTLISAYRGDVCSTLGSLYTNDGPGANGTNSTMCTPPSETGEFFHPSEMHGVTMQEGPNGNTAARPTYWFWHEWACAQNISGCPWVGHANASRMFDGYVATVGHGGVLNTNIAPQADGLLNASVVEVMYDFGKAVNDTFKFNNAGEVLSTSGSCKTGVVVVNVTDDFDYIVTMEDLRQGQRVGNYSIDYRVRGSDVWDVLVPPVQPTPPTPPPTTTTMLGDRPDGHDPRDQYIGHKRIDTPIVSTRGRNIEQVRFNCLRLIANVPHGDTIYIRKFSLHKKQVPWENTQQQE